MDFSFSFFFTPKIEVVILFKTTITLLKSLHPSRIIFLLIKIDLPLFSIVPATYNMLQMKVIISIHSFIWRPLLVLSRKLSKNMMMPRCFLGTQIVFVYKAKVIYVWEHTHCSQILSKMRRNLVYGNTQNMMIAK